MTTENIDTPLKADCNPRLVRLLQCGRKSCGYVLTDDEREWKSVEYGKRAICSQCGCDSFYTLNEKGQQITTRDREKYRDGIDPTTIEPSPRMGPKMTKAIIRAKWHAINQANDTVEQPAPTKTDEI
jgi:hypothetical protein